MPRCVGYLVIESRLVGHHGTVGLVQRPLPCVAGRQGEAHAARPVERGFCRCFDAFDIHPPDVHHTPDEKILGGDGHNLVCHAVVESICRRRHIAHPPVQLLVPRHAAAELHGLLGAQRARPHSAIVKVVECRQTEDILVHQPYPQVAARKRLDRQCGSRRKAVPPRSCLPAMHGLAGGGREDRSGERQAVEHQTSCQDVEHGVAHRHGKAVQSGIHGIDDAVGGQ